MDSNLVRLVQRPRLEGKRGCSFGAHEQPIKILFRLRLETKVQTDASEMILQNGGQTEEEKWHPNRGAL